MTTLTKQNLTGIAQELRANDPQMVDYIFDLYDFGGMEYVNKYIAFHASLQPRRRTIMEKVEDGMEKFLEWLKTLRMISYYKEGGIMWFRIFGYGLHFKDTTRERLIFSERMGLAKRLKVGKWLIGGLWK